MENYKDEIPKHVIERCRMEFNDNAVYLFRKIEDQGGYAMLSILQNGNQDDTFYNPTEKIFVVKSGIIEGVFFCSPQIIKNGASKVKSIMRGSRIKQ